MMHVLHRTAMVALWALAALGIACGAVWGLTALGIIKPLVVISGSMEPEIMTGDLLIASPTAAGEIAVGEVVSLPSELTEHLVTHRVTSITPAADGAFTVTMKGDNNDYEDALDYTIAGEVWQPTMQLAGWGTALMRLSTPAVAVPLGMGLLALLGLTLLTPSRSGRSPKQATAQSTAATAAT